MNDSVQSILEKALGDIKEGRLLRVDALKIAGLEPNWNTSYGIIGPIMRDLGWKLRQTKIDNYPTWAYVKGEYHRRRGLKAPPILYVYRDPISGSLTIWPSDQIMPDP
jgi:hypothetical protein